MLNDLVSFMMESDYSGSRKGSSVVVLEDGPAPSTLSSKLLNPASATFGMKSSSTRTFAVLKFI